jgi:hypothetical protein
MPGGSIRCEGFVFLLRLRCWFVSGRARASAASTAAQQAQRRAVERISNSSHTLYRRYSLVAGGSCTHCLPGTFNPVVASNNPKDCKSCGPGMTSRAGTTVSDDCFTKESISFNLYVYLASPLAGEIMAFSKQANRFVKVLDDSSGLMQPESVVFVSPSNMLVSSFDSNQVSAPCERVGDVGALSNSSPRRS